MRSVIQQAILFLGFATLGLPAKTQMPEFYVQLVKGEAAKLTTAGKEFQLHQYDYIKPSEKIIIRKAGASITLVDKDTNFYVVKDPGIYSVEQVRKKRDHRRRSAYADLGAILLHNTAILGDPEKITPERVAGNLGADRSGDDCDPATFPVGGMRTSADSLVFKWTHPDGIKTWQFRLTDRTNKELRNIELSDTMIRFASGEIKALLAAPGDENVINWSVLPQGGSCRIAVSHTIYLLTAGKEADNIAPLLKKIKPTGNEVDYNLQVAELLASRGYFDRAADYYDKARIAWQNR